MPPSLDSRCVRKISGKTKWYNYDYSGHLSYNRLTSCAFWPVAHGVVLQSCAVPLSSCHLHQWKENSVDWKIDQRHGFTLSRVCRLSSTISTNRSNVPHTCPSVRNCQFDRILQRVLLLPSSCMLCISRTFWMKSKETIIWFITRHSLVERRARYLFYCMFVCSVNDFSKTGGPIYAKVRMPAYSGSGCVFSPFGGWRPSAGGKRGK